MIINGKWMNEPEIITLISQLTADKKRLERQMAEKKKGYWVEEEDGGYDPYYTCSECGLSLSKSDYTKEEWQEIFNYCPCCGADMRGTGNVQQI